MKKLLLTLLFAASATVNAQDFWTEVAPFGNNSNYHPGQISIVDADVVWARALPNAGPAYNQYSISTDGGITWASGDINLGSTSLGVAWLHAVSATRAYVAGFPNTPGTIGGIWMTDDAGATWTQQTTAFNSTTSFANIVYFFDLNNGVAVGDPVNGGFQIYTTSNGGTNWVQVPQTDIPAPISIAEYGYTAIFEARGNHFWFGTNRGRIYHSEDLGLHWSVNQSPCQDFGDSDLGASFAFKNDQEGMVVYRDWSWGETTDGGLTWSLISVPFFNAPRNHHVVYVPETNNAYFSWGEGVVDGIYGATYTTDGGDNWIDLNTEDTNPVIPFDAEFQSGTVGFCIGQYQNGPSGARFFKLTDPLFRLLKNEPFIAASKFEAAPNPTTDVVKLSGANITQVVVCDLSGKVISTQDYGLVNEAVLDVSTLPHGMYLAKISGEHGASSSVKIVKK
ncbi:T9SS type A sorting domain-containing protein [Flavobacterium sp.]|uniref:T9SS type A sorting domain-containing protein n=1 Tax=Flavobacterium sp. TaxID=239 RepID=UPI0039E527AA